MEKLHRFPPGEPQIEMELEMSPQWEEHGFAKPVHHLLTYLWKHDNELATDLQEDGCELEYDLFYLEQYDHSTNDRSKFAPVSEKPIDGGMKHQWQKWQKFPLFQVELRYSSSLFPVAFLESHRWWEHMTCEMLIMA